MLRFKVNEAKSFFLDRVVTAAVDKATVRVLSRFGAFVRTRARGLIRRAKKTSRPGRPPRSITGLLKRFIFFVFDPSRKSVVIGPVRLNSKSGGEAPATLEHGGESTIASGRGKARKERTVRIEPRPFMGPAYAAEAPKLPGMWRDSVK